MFHKKTTFAQQPTHTQTYKTYTEGVEVCWAHTRLVSTPRERVHAQHKRGAAPSSRCAVLTQRDLRAIMMSHAICFDQSVCVFFCLQFDSRVNLTRPARHTQENFEQRRRQRRRVIRGWLGGLVVHTANSTSPGVCCAHSAIYFSEEGCDDGLFVGFGASFPPNFVPPSSHANTNSRTHTHKHTENSRPIVGGPTSISVKIQIKNK